MPTVHIEERDVKVMLEKTSLTKRLGYIDFLKFIGLTGIIIAHISPPQWLMVARSFDVPFMVILSSILAEKSYAKYIDKQISPVNYLVNRTKRLVIPTWIFLIIYFSAYFVLSDNLFSIKYYIASFCLTRYGIGYVWIILIYLYSALLIPLFHKMKLSKKGILLLVFLYLLYEIAYYFEIGIDNKLIETTFYYIIPYGVLTYFGYNYSRLKKIHKCIIAIVALGIFISFGLYYWIQTGTFQSVQIAKYPPRFYYLGFGVAISFSLLLICENKHFKIFDNKIVRFIAKHSMWIYLWHVLVLTAYSILDLPEIWYIKLPLVYLASMLIVLAVNKILDIIEKGKSFKFLSYFRG